MPQKKHKLNPIETERQRCAERYLRQRQELWPSDNQLSVHLGMDAYNCELIIICGKLNHIADYDWYMQLALEELDRVACYQGEGRYGQLKFKTVDCNFVWQYRNAIRENYNHGRNIPSSGFRSLRQIKMFIQATEMAEELSMIVATG